MRWRGRWLLLAGGTGLAPFLSMLEVLAQRQETRPIRLIYGVTRDQDLVMIEALQAFTARLPELQLGDLRG